MPNQIRVVITKEWNRGGGDVVSPGKVLILDMAQARSLFDQEIAVPYSDYKTPRKRMIEDAQVAVDGDMETAEAGSRKRGRPGK